MTDAVVLSGAVTMGAFTAGALAALTSPDAREHLRLDVRRIVAASSGALNAAYYASAICAGTDLDAGLRLTQIWLEEGTVSGGFAVSPRGVITARGISSDAKLLALLREHVRPLPAPRRPIEVRFIVSTTRGATRSIAGHAATTFEVVRTFDESAFATDDSLDAMFQTIAASSAFPGIYEPVPLTIDGEIHDCVDGGVTSNAPVREAIGDDRDVDRLFVILPYPRLVAPSTDLHGLALVARIAQMLVQERLVRDLEDAYDVNLALARLEALEPDEARRAPILDALGWSKRRAIEIIEIRPEHPLEGNAFSGLFSRDLRVAYSEAGSLAAKHALGL